MHKDPTLWQAAVDFFGSISAYVIFAIMGAWGGAVNYMQDVKKNGLPFSWRNLHIEVFSSSFVGVILGMFMKYMNMPDLVIWGTLGVAGHMGTRTLMILVQNRTVPFLAENYRPQDKEEASHSTGHSKHKSQSEDGED